MRVVLLVMCCFLSLISFGQGLNGELGFNDDYSQNATGVVVFNDYSLYIKQQTESASFFTRSSLVKVDSLENILWDIPINPQTAEVVEVKKIIKAEIEGVYVLGYARPTCDISGGCFWFLQKMDANGLVVWTRTWQDQICFAVSVSGLSLSQNGQVLVHYSDPVSSVIYTLDPGNGNEISTINPVEQGFQGIEQLSGYNTIAYKQFSLFGFDGSGNVSNNLTFSSFITDFQVWNDSLFVATSDSLFIFDITFQQIEAEEIDPNPFNLKVDHEIIGILHDATNSISLKQYNRNLSEIASFSFPTGNGSHKVADYNDNRLTAVIDFPISEYYVLRHLDYSMVSNQNEPVNWTDIGVADIQITQSSATLLPNFQSVFDVEIAADVLVKNYGSEVLESCRLNHYVSPALACGLIYYGEEFFNLNLAPGDSVWISLGTIHNATRSFPSDSLIQEICLYTSFPNQKTDLIVDNDRLCTNVVLGQLSVLETTQPSDKKLVRVTDLLGREIHGAHNQWVIHLYDDGSTQKVFQYAH